MPCGHRCLTVRILNEQPVHVLPGSSLVLKAHIEPVPLDQTSHITWERESETGVDPHKVTLASCSSRGLQCNNMRSNVKVSMQEQEATLQINGFSNSDTGVYALAVRNQTGAETHTARCIVRIYGTV